MVTMIYTETKAKTQYTAVMELMIFLVDQVTMIFMVKTEMMKFGVVKATTQLEVEMSLEELI